MEAPFEYEPTKVHHTEQEMNFWQHGPRTVIFYNPKKTIKPKVGITLKRISEISTGLKPTNSDILE